MPGARSPALSVILVTPDRYAAVRKTVRHLRAQTARERLELVLVAPSRAGLGLDLSELKDFAAVQVVEVGPIDSTARVRAEGVRRARAPVVVLAEEHSYPEPGWAEALIEAHRYPWAAVGPAVGNANPDSRMSWALLFITFGRWIEPAAGPTDDLPGHNSSYKRAVLLEYGDDLEAMMEAETVLHADLRARGHQLYLEPAAVTRHLNSTRLAPCLMEQLHYGRMFAGARARPWSWARRRVYGLAGPLIPLVRLRRVVREIRRTGRQGELLPGILPALLAVLSASALGEVAGYLFGAGAAARHQCGYEFYRERHVRRPPRAA